MHWRAMWAALCILIGSIGRPALAQVTSDWGGSDCEWGAVPAGCECTCDDGCSSRWPLYPTMLGDLAGFGGFNFGISSFQFSGTSGVRVLGFPAPIPVFRGAYKIAENESPVPQDRIFLGYNFYHNVSKIADVHRETPGFEKTFLDGRASIGMRVPAIQVIDDVGGADYGDFADLTVPFKYALYLNEATGNVFSTGLAVTAPTGPYPTAVIFKNDSLQEVHPTLLQPFVGYYWGRGNWFLQGFHSVMVPTLSEDVTALFNDVGVGYWIEAPGDFITALIPTLEVHVNTPLDQRSLNDFPRYRDAVNLTAGGTMIVGDRITISSALVTPLTGPHLFDLEAIASLNVFY